MNTPLVNHQQLLDTILANKPIIKELKLALATISETLNAKFTDGESIELVMQARAAAIDEILLALWHFYELHKADCDLIAVGGFGRGELHPHSDIDLLIQVGDEENLPPNLEQFLTSLWDLSLDIGHSVRSLSQTLALAETDLTVVTGLMETRLLFGNKDRYQALIAGSSIDHMWPAQQFYGHKWEEQIIRHKKFADTEYSLEPNLKNGPGGLRDVQILRWIALRKFNTSNFRDLQLKGVITIDEANSLIESERYLQSLRWALHTLAKREEDRLLFDHQRALAKNAGFEDSDDALAVEKYMQLYYQHSMNISSLNELLMQAFEESIWESFSQTIPKPINERFQLRDGHIEPIIGDRLFFEEPSALIEVFLILADDAEIAGMTVSCIRGISKAKHLIDEDFRANEKNRKLFASLMNTEHKLTTQLRRMNQLGILGCYLPEWTGIVGRMQHDLFHIYTVDAHTINVIKNMRLFTYDGGNQKFPLASEVIRSLPKLDLLYTAGLYHDIAKGRGGDHSTLGGVDARNYCVRHGYNEQDTDLVVWLVENHLLMSSTSQRKDISDPDIIREFALTVGNENYLNYLFVLTVADINATNPTLWTSWRASLLRQLYNETRRALRKGLEKESQRDDWIASTKRIVRQLMAESSYSEEEILPLWRELSEDYFLRETAADIAWHTDAILNHQGGPAVIIKDTNSRRHEGATQIFIYTPKERDLFVKTTSLLTELNLSIQDARIYSAPGGYSLDTYIVLNADNQPISNDNAQHLYIQQALEKGLEQDEAQDPTSRRIPRVLKHFSAPTTVDYTNDIETHTVLEVSSPDRPGVLATIAGVLSQFQVALTAAKITTLGERVEDILFISDQEGKAITDELLLSKLTNTIKRELDQQTDHES